MENASRVLSAAMLIVFILLFGLGLLLGVCRPDYLSYPAAFLGGVLLLGLFVLRQRRRGSGPTLWQRLGEGRSLALLLVLCFLLNLAWALSFRLRPTVDYASFWGAACYLAGKSEDMLREYVALFPHILGYSSFLSVFLRLFGNGALTAPIVNVCLSTLSGYFLFRLTRCWRSLDAAAFVLLVWALYPSKLLYNTMVLSEPWYTCLLLGFLCLVSELESRPIATAAAALFGALAGLLLRLVNAARPIAAVPILALLIWLLLLRKERGLEARRRWTGFVALLLAVYLATGPLWTGFARRVLEEEPASVPGYSLYVGLNMESMGSYSQEDMDLLLHYRYDFPDGSAVEAQNRMLEEAKTRLQDPDTHLVPLFFVKLRTLLGNDEGGAYYSRAGLSERAYALLALYSNVWYYALGLLALGAAVKLLRQGERRSALLAPLYIVGLILAQLLVEVSGRYHYSIIPMLLLLTGFACPGQEADTKPT